MWPDVLFDIKKQVTERLADIDETALIYFGASTLVPNVSQVNVYRGTLTPDPDVRICESHDDQMVVFIDIWVNEDVDQKIIDQFVIYQDLYGIPDDWDMLYREIIKKMTGTVDSESVYESPDSQQSITEMTDIDYENYRTFFSYLKLDKFSRAIRTADFEGAGYSSTFVKIESDGDQFRPTCAERIEYLIEMEY